MIAGEFGMKIEFEALFIHDLFEMYVELFPHLF
jgi:hypothetical protein